MPSGSQTGLKLVSGFTVPANGSASFTIDFDLRKSVTSPQAQGSDLFLKPALRVVDNAQAGAIAGRISPAMLADARCPDQNDPSRNDNVAYDFSGAGVSPDDVDGGAVEPITAARAERDDSGTYHYRAAFLLPGDYTVAFACQAASDDPEREDMLVFPGTQAVSVAAGRTTIADFQVDCWPG